MKIDGQNIDFSRLDDYNFPEQSRKLQNEIDINEHRWSKAITANLDVEIPKDVASGKLAVLLEPAKKYFGDSSPEIEIELNGQTVKPEIQGEDGAWHWYKVDLENGQNEAAVIIKPIDKNKWQGKLSLYVINEVEHKSAELSYELEKSIDERPMPPLPWDKGITKQIHELQTSSITIGK